MSEHEVDAVPDHEVIRPPRPASTADGTSRVARASHRRWAAPAGRSRAFALLAVLTGSLVVAGAVHAAVDKPQIAADMTGALALSPEPVPASQRADAGPARLEANWALVSAQYQGSHAHVRALRTRDGDSLTRDDALRLRDYAVAGGIPTRPGAPTAHAAARRDASGVAASGPRAATAASRTRPGSYGQYYGGSISQYQFSGQISTLRSLKSRRTTSHIVEGKASATGQNKPQIGSASAMQTAGYYARFPRGIPTQNLSAAAAPQALATWFMGRVAPVISPTLRVVSAVLAATPLLGDVLPVSKPFTSRGPAASVGRETKTRPRNVPAQDVQAEQLPDTRRLLQLGLVFAMAYLVFLIFWFWATRARRGGARDIRL
jgi:hypothetical protein